MVLVPFATAVATLVLIGAVHAKDMSFRLVEPRKCRTDCTSHLVATGRITADSYRSFLEVAGRLPRGVPVHLNSPGGTLVGGMLLGLALRERGAVVSVAKGAVCASACAYAFLGGVRRQVPSGSRLGVHRFYTASDEFRALPTNEQTAITQQANLALRGYIIAMGAQPELATFAARIAPSKIHFMNGRELRRYGVTTAQPPARKAVRADRNHRADAASRAPSRARGSRRRITGR